MGLGASNPVNAASVVKIKVVDGRRNVKMKIRVDPGPPIKASGNFSDLYRGTDPMGQAIALKRCRIAVRSAAKEEEDLIEMEAMIWQTLKHDNILQFLGKGKDKLGFLYLASYWVDQGNLWEYIQAYPQAPRVGLLCDTARAVAYLHSREYVHGDVKAQNVLVSNNGRALLCDFRLTRKLNVATAAGLKGIGSLQFQSPELWRGAPRSTKSDVYAFGLTIYQVLSGNLPFNQHTTHAAILRAVMTNNERPAHSPAFSPVGEDYTPVWKVADRCWAAEPADRPEMEDVVEQWPSL